MAAIPQPKDTTVAAIYAAIVSTSEKRRSNRLGASQIGTECRRALWLGFRWADDIDHDGKTLRLFRRGTLEEAQFIADLRAAGMQVEAFDKNGQQFEFTAVGGHFVAKIDAAVLGLPEAAKTWHDVSFKTMNEKRFKAFVKDGIAKAEPKYYAQIQAEMKVAGFERGALLAVNKNTDELHLERVKPDETGARMIERAETIVKAPEPLEKLSVDPNHFACKFCNARTVCHEGRLPEPTCRTCVHATPELDGNARWSCAYHHKDLAVVEQRAGCVDHVYIPHLVPLEFMGGDADGNWAEYRLPDGTQVHNGTPKAGAYASSEMYAAQDSGFKALSLEFVQYLRSQMGGVLIASSLPDALPDDIEQLRAALPLPNEQAA